MKQMKQIGGFFTCEELPAQPNDFFETLCPPEGDFEFFMSGRCANYYVLSELALKDKKKVAYVPMYTCETVLAPFIKAGYRLLFYLVDKDMAPVFDDSVLDQISVVNLCGYYGFCRYDRTFIRRCSEKGITILQDATHSVFSLDGMDPHCDYVVGSLRKWIGIPAGGFAIRKKGSFSLPLKPPHKKHLALREQTVFQTGHPLTAEDRNRLYAAFWDGELMLRSMFDCYGSDPASVCIMTHYDFDSLSKIRRENFTFMLKHLPATSQMVPVFTSLPPETVPSHFTVYAKNRERVREYLDSHGIHSTVYWPVSPMADPSGCEDVLSIYEHVLSLPCDQRYGEEDMEYICETIREMPYWDE